MTHTQPEKPTYELIYFSPTTFLYHQSYAVARKTVGEELRQLAVPVGNVDSAVALLLRTELRDAVAEHHEALVDVVGLLERLALAARLFGHLGSGQVDEIDLAVSRDVDALVVLARRLLLRVNVHREDRVRPGRVLVHVVVPDGAVLQTCRVQSRENADDGQIISLPHSLTLL